MRKTLTGGFLPNRQETSAKLLAARGALSCGTSTTSGWETNSRCNDGWSCGGVCREDAAGVPKPDVPPPPQRDVSPQATTVSKGSNEKSELEKQVGIAELNKRLQDAMPNEKSELEKQVDKAELNKRLQDARL